jgi:hypothetical protein
MTGSNPRRPPGTSWGVCGETGGWSVEGERVGARGPYLAGRPMRTLPSVCGETWMVVRGRWSGVSRFSDLGLCGETIFWVFHLRTCSCSPCPAMLESAIRTVELYAPEAGQSGGSMKVPSRTTRRRGLERRGRPWLGCPRRRSARLSFPDEASGNAGLAAVDEMTADIRPTAAENGRIPLACSGSARRGSSK